jgi:DNA-binding XRE family transcriptional regulator
MNLLIADEENEELQKILIGIGRCICKGYADTLSLNNSQKKDVPVKSRIAFNLKKLRSRKGLLQKEVASALGIPVGTYMNHENAKYEPSPRFLSAYAQYFGVSAEDLKEEFYEN